MKQFHGSKSKMEYAIVTLMSYLDGRGNRSEADAAISAYTRVLADGVDSLDKIDIDDMCHDICAKWDD